MCVIINNIILTELFTNKIKLESFESSGNINENMMGHTAVLATQASSVTLSIWQHGARDNYRNFYDFLS